jgi:hypothetical protein
MKASVLVALVLTLLAAINLVSGFRFHAGNSVSFLAAFAASLLAFAASLLAFIEWSKVIKSARQRRGQ